MIHSQNLKSKASFGQKAILTWRQFLNFYDLIKIEKSWKILLKQMNSMMGIFAFYFISFWTPIKNQLLRIELMHMYKQVQVDRNRGALF